MVKLGNVVKLYNLLTILEDNNIEYNQSKENVIIAIENGEEILEEIHNIKFKVKKERKSVEIIIPYVVKYESLIDRLIHSKFYEYKFVKGYEAIWSSEKGIIECEIDVRIPTYTLINRINSLKEGELELIDEEECEVESRGKSRNIVVYNVKGIAVEIGYASDEYLALVGAKTRMLFRRYSKNDSVITMKLKNCKIDKHDSVIKLIEKVGLSSVFMLIQSGMPIVQLRSEKNYNMSPKISKSILSTEKNKLLQPKFEYDVEPLSLYIHAKSKESLPLYTYLAYYQVLEFYFPKYSEMSVKNMLKRTLKDPYFNYNNDGHLNTLLELIKTNKSNSYTDEITSLTSTISGCISRDELMKFCIKNYESEYFKSSIASELSSSKISLNEKNEKIIEQVSNRVYEIRCQIVHRKATFSNGKKSILPYKIGYNEIISDLKLIEYLAYKTLIENSSNINI